jgi:hypothetical protein
LFSLFAFLRFLIACEYKKCNKHKPAAHEAQVDSSVQNASQVDDALARLEDNVLNSGSDLRVQVRVGLLGQGQELEGHVLDAVHATGQTPHQRLLALDL